MISAAINAITKLLRMGCKSAAAKSNLEEEKTTSSSSSSSLVFSLRFKETIQRDKRGGTKSSDPDDEEDGDSDTAGARSCRRVLFEKLSKNVRNNVTLSSSSSSSVAR